MKVVVFGSNSMLGTCIVNILSSQHIPWYAARDNCSNINTIDPDVVINCAGINIDPIQMIKMNALFPHELAQSTNRPILHISTDRVFNGRTQGPYSTNQSTDAVDVFGRTKALGEVRAPHVHNVRMSFVGKNHGFVKQLMETPDDFKGLANVRWSGSTVEVVAGGIVRLLDDIYRLPQVIHLATEESITRYDAALLVTKHFALAHNIQKFDDPTANYSLLPTHIIPSFEEAIKQW